MSQHTPVVHLKDARLIRATLGQAWPPWGDDLTGSSSASMALIGCALTALASAARFLGGDLSITPGALNARAKLITGAFFGDAAVVPHVLAPHIGLVAEAKLSMDDPKKPASHDELVDEIVRVLGLGGVCMVHVDTDAGRPGTSVKGNHYVLAVGFTEEDNARLVTLDPANGEVIFLDFPDLACAAPPRRPRPYSARAVRGLFRRPEA